MDTIEHSYKTIKGIIDREPTVKDVPSGEMWLAKLHAIDNEIYNLVAFKEDAKHYKVKYHEGSYIEVSGKHQTKTFNEDVSEELVFCKIKRWNPAWKKSLEIGNALSNLCTRVLDKQLALSENEPHDAESQIKYAQYEDLFNRCMLAMQLLNHECRPLDDYEGSAQVKLLVFDGKENVLL